MILPYLYNHTYIVITSLIGAITVFYITPILATVALRLGIVDKPDSILKKHEKITPYLGGLAVYCGFIVSLALLFPFKNDMFLFLVGTTLLLLLGLIDDLVVLLVQQKFFGQIIATFCFLKAGFYLREVFFSSFFNVIISFFWIVTITNAFNLIDVMDGLATSIAIISSISFLACALMLDQFDVALLLAAFIGALIGFLWHNKPLASIYLGDSGSLFIGGFLATIAFMLPWGTYNALGFLVPVIILAIPLLEIAALIVIRTYKEIPFYRGSPDHFCHYLKRKNWPVKRILLFVMSLNVLLGLIATAFTINSLSFGMLCLFLSTLIAFWLIVVYRVAQFRENMPIVKNMLQFTFFAKKQR